uniref:L-Fucosyltransferase n=1 Tax=Panagrellus redivivus TaxID=6233 RepID=A0A7E4VP59_PANRE
MRLLRCATVCERVFLAVINNVLQRFRYRYAMMNGNGPLLLGCLAAVTLTFVLICATGSSRWNSTQQYDLVKSEITSEQFYAALKAQKCPVITCPTEVPIVQNGNTSESSNQTIVIRKTMADGPATKIEPLSPDVRCTSKSLLEQAYDRLYIGCNFGATGGIGNQIWRFASIYGIGRYTGREPFFESKNTDQMNNLLEIAVVFPMMHEVLQIKSPPEEFMKKYHFANDCCKFDDPKKLLGLKDKYVKVAGDYMQSYKFFHPYRDEIRRIFECGLPVKLSVENFAKNVFLNDNSFKLCAHIRRGDFIGDIMLESKEDFTVPALKYALDDLKSKGHHNVSMLFIGNDHPFVANLPIKNHGFHQIYMPESRSRGEDMCLGINHCDAMVMTASGSTFGWWIAYLMKPGAPIYYNSQITDNADFTKDVHDFDIFPPDWTMLTVKDGVAVKETQWWHQRRGQPPDLPSADLVEWV